MMLTISPYWVLLSCLFLSFIFLYFRKGFWAWVLPVGIFLFYDKYQGIFPEKIHLIFSLLFIGLAFLFGVPLLRRMIVSSFLMKMVASFLPRLGKTERIALDAGTVWWDGDLFSGNPNWERLLHFSKPSYSEKEKAFIDGPLQELCRQLDEWQNVQRGDLPKEIWDFLKKKGFMGMIIPEEYGGLGFSAVTHSQVITTIASRSPSAAVTAMVPNSLGPAELILHYGTQEQKKYYLPRLAKGEEVPCFALTGPEAGSDAAAMQSMGIVERGNYEGKDVLGMRLNWDKRYITLGPVATVIGLAFRLKDPHGLLGDKKDLGITCALIPAHLPGIDIGKRHDPMGIPFQNGPNFGKDVFVPLDFIIGGSKMAGHGWKMLMESLAAGRSISLPSYSVGVSQMALRVVSAYATVREQFDTPIGRFEGIEEALARMGGLTYLMNAARLFTAQAVDDGEKPSVVSAIVKAYVTEGMRGVVNDGMDIRAGAGISRGPKNVMARLYASIPIGITVEGANILTRCMIIYGQGAIRCHPYVRKQIDAIGSKDLKQFDSAFFAHINFFLGNGVRSFVFGATQSRFLYGLGGHIHRNIRKYFKHLTRASSAFTFVSDVAMLTLGGKLKRSERISGRLADCLAWMYLASASLKRFVDEGQQNLDLPFVSWACEHSLFQIQSALKGILDNLPNRLLAILIKPVIFPLGLSFRVPSDRLSALVARGLLEDRDARQHLTKDIFIPPESEEGLGRMEAALDKAVDALKVETKIKDAIRQGKLDRAPGDQLIQNAKKANIISEEEVQKILLADEARKEAIQVDAFPFNEFRNIRG